MKRLIPGGPVPRLVLLGLAVALLGWLMRGMPEQTPGARWWPWLLIGGIAEVLAVAAYCAHRRGSSAGKVERWADRSQRNDGVASAWEIWRASGRHAIRRMATQLRPSAAELGWFDRLRVPTREYGTALARVGWQRIWSAIEDVTIRIGGPRTGKSGELGCRILDAPGAVIATSTRTDLLDKTGPVRSRKGPVYVFNPSGIGKRVSTITFDPLSGCTDPRTAVDRAADLLSGSSSPGRGAEGDFWTDQAKRTLACLLHAAALGDATMRDVLSWVADPDEAAGDVRRFIRRSSEPAFEAELVQFLGNNDRTRTSICTTIMPALGWLRDATAAAAATGGGFDVPDLLARRGTVYMLGAEDAQVAPLVTALTGHIAREARRIAADSPGGRLDPPLTLVLDEAALICPVPLDSWTADMGGRGVTIHIAVQSRAQLRQRWGDTGAAAILNNAASLLIFGGSKDHEDLAAYSALTGERYEKVENFDKDGVLTGHTTRRVPVLTPAQISNLPRWHVVVIKRGMAPAIGVVPLMWNRRDVRRAKRQAARAAKRAMWAAEIALARTFLAEELTPRLKAAWARACEFAARLDEQGRAGLDEAVRNVRAHRAARRDRRNHR